MSEKYLPIRESVGYKNVRLAMLNVFNFELDNITIHEGDFENFNFKFLYNQQELTLAVTSSEKNRQLEAGEGGIFNIWFPNPNYPKTSILDIQFFYDLLDDEEKSKKVKRVFGDNEPAVEEALVILKEYLDKKMMFHLLFPSRQSC